MIINPTVSGGIQLPELVTPAGAGQILGGFQAIGVDGEVITGNILSQGAQAFTPGTVAQQIPAGKYLSGAQTIAGDANLKAENIAEGVSIFGVTGTHSGGEPIPLLGGPYANLMDAFNDGFDPRYMLVFTYIDIPSNLPGGEGGGFGLITIDAPDVYQVLSQYMLIMLPMGLDLESDVLIDFYEASNTRPIGIRVEDSYGFYINDKQSLGNAYVDLTDGSVTYTNFSSKISYQIYVVSNN